MRAPKGTATNPHNITNLYSHCDAILIYGHDILLHNA